MLLVKTNKLAILLIIKKKCFNINIKNIKILDVVFDAKQTIFGHNVFRIQ